MSNTFKEYLRNGVLNHVFGGVTLSPATTLYIGLSTTAVADDGTNITEPVGGSYARVAVTNDKTTGWTSASGATNEVSNVGQISFAEATANWGTIVDFFIADALTVGNILASASLTVSKTVATGDIASFPSGSLIINLDDV